MYGIQGEDSMSNTKEQKIGYRDIFRQTEYMKIMIAAMTNEFDFTGSLPSNSGKVSIVSVSSC